MGFLEASSGILHNGLTFCFAYKMPVKLHVPSWTKNRIEFAEFEIASGITHNGLTFVLVYKMHVKLFGISWTQNRI